MYVYRTIILYLFYVLLMKNSNKTCQIILLIYLVNEASELRNKNAFPIILFGRMRMTEYTDKPSITHLMHIICCTCSTKHQSLKLNEDRKKKKLSVFLAQSSNFYLYSPLYKWFQSSFKSNKQKHNSCKIHQLWNDSTFMKLQFQL